MYLNSDGAVLEDLGSKNGILYNNKPLTDPVLLTDGDNFQIALAQKFVFLSSDSTIPLENQSRIFERISNSGHKFQLKSAEDGMLRLEKQSRQVFIQTLGQKGERKEKEILPPLSVSQFRLLEVLYDNPGRVIPRPELVAAVWGEGQVFDISEQALDALIRRLRDRIANVNSEHAYIITVRGHGLRLENPSLLSD